MALIWLSRESYGSIMGIIREFSESFPRVFRGYWEMVLEIIEIGYWLGFIKVQYNY